MRFLVHLIFLSGMFMFDCALNINLFDFNILCVFLSIFLFNLFFFYAEQSNTISRVFFCMRITRLDFLAPKLLDLHKVCVFTYMHKCKTNAHAPLCTRTHASTYAHTQAHTHTHTHMRAHI